MIGWALLLVLVAYLVGSAMIGLGWRLRRAGSAGFVRRFVVLGPWLGAALGVFYLLLTWSPDRGTVDVALSFVVGAAAGVALTVAALGWDEFYDRLWPTFYAALRREVYTHFATPVPYVVLFLFVLLSGLFFWANLKLSRIVSLRPVFDSVSSIGFFLFPLLTMGLFSREKSEGTIEVLLTAPVSDAAITVAKFLGTMAFYLAMLLPTLVYFVVLRYVGHSIGKPDVGPAVTAYLGMVLTGGFFISMGLFASSLWSSQILSALVTWILIIVFLLSAGISEVMGLSGTWLGNVLEYLDPIRGHLETFLKGVIDPKDVVYFLSLTLFFLFLSVRTIESSKWR